MANCTFCVCQQFVWLWHNLQMPLKISFSCVLTSYIITTFYWVRESYVTGITPSPLNYSPVARLTSEMMLEVTFLSKNARCVFIQFMFCACLQLYNYYLTLASQLRISYPGLIMLSCSIVTKGTVVKSGKVRVFINPRN